MTPPRITVGELIEYLKEENPNLYVVYPYLTKEVPNGTKYVNSYVVATGMDITTPGLRPPAQMLVLGSDEELRAMGFVFQGDE